jgi:hypothetical protein
MNYFITTAQRQRQPSNVVDFPRDPEPVLWKQFAAAVEADVDGDFLMEARYRRLAAYEKWRAAFVGDVRP